MWLTESCSQNFSVDFGSIRSSWKKVSVHVYPWGWFWNKNVCNADKVIIDMCVLYNYCYECDVKWMVNI